MRHRFKTGSKVILCKTLYRRRPSQRAHEVRPAKYGDTYSYTVDKYRKVQAVTPDGKLVLVTPKGNIETVSETCPCLRKAGWLQQLMHRRDFARIA